MQKSSGFDKDCFDLYMEPHPRAKADSPTPALRAAPSPT